MNQLQLHPKHKLLIISKYIYSKLRQRFSIYNITSTWVKHNLDSIVKEYTKRWLQLPQSAKARHLSLPVRGHSYIYFHGNVRHVTFCVYPHPHPLHQNVTPCLLQSSYLTVSWIPLQSVGAACSIHILHSNAMLKSYGLSHVDHYAFDIDSIFTSIKPRKHASRMFD